MRGKRDAAQGADRVDAQASDRNWRAAYPLAHHNVTAQPAYRDVHYRVIGNLENTNTIMHRTFWIGHYPGITAEMITYVIEVFERFCRGV